MRAKYHAPTMSGEELKRIRSKKSLRLSQADVGRLTGYSRDAVGIWERSDDGAPFTVAQIMWVLDDYPELLLDMLKRAGVE